MPELPFRLRQVLSGPHENFHYVVADPSTRQAVLIDPAFNVERLVDEERRAGSDVVGALFTHAHGDHIGGAAQAARLGVRWLAVHEAAAAHPRVEEARQAGAEVRLLRDGDVLDVGRLPIQALHTPGHQPESTCFMAGAPTEPQALFGGDCLFIGSCGRTDFPGGDTDAMFRSMARLRRLPPDVIVFPGHHYAKEPHRPLREEALENPALATADRQRFEALPFLRG